MITETTVSSDECIIAAPVDLVWQVLTDFANYGDWNSFCPSAQAELRLGSPVVMKVDLGFGLQDQTETLCRLEPPHVIAWRMANEPGDPIHAVRTQTLTPVGDASCRYESIDEFSGDALADMMEAMAKPVETGFNRCAADLKRHCEALYQARTA